ncbi:MAG: dTDP-4-dehydrorhamnose 3,5-epimerase [Chloroflexota bacterium]
MIFTQTELKDAYIIEPKRIEDERGAFVQVWDAAAFERLGLPTRIVLINESYNRRRGTLRGMHFQRAPYAQAKLVRCIRGALHDVIVDLRPDSPSYLRWIGVDLTEENGRMLYVPEGFAHGFQTLVDDTRIQYQVSEVYAPQAEGGYRYDDPAFGISWPLPVTSISQKDLSWPPYDGAPPAHT